MNAASLDRLRLPLPPTPTNNVCPCCNNVVLGTAAQNSGFAAVNDAAPVYQLSNISMQVEVLGMATSVLDQIVEQRIAQVGYVSLPFKNYFSYTSTHVSTTKFHVNSASVISTVICGSKPVSIMPGSRVPRKLCYI